MIRTAWAALPLLFLTSCGIIAIEYLPPPPVESYTNQTDFTKLQHTHNDGTYSSNEGFQGYEVYYKLYAPLTGPFDNLAADYSALQATTPTVDYLVNLGYQRLTASDLNSGNLPIIDRPGNGVITLDFGAFLDKMNVPDPPTDHEGSEIGARPTLQVGSDSPFFVFRTIKTSGVFSYPWFSDLYRPWTSATSDMKTGTPGPSSNAIGATTQYYQIAFFLVAYSFTPEQTIYSQPVPWGVIGGDNLTYLKVYQ